MKISANPFGIVWELQIRTIKPTTFLDEDLAGLPFEARLFFIGLWTQADREGRLEDRPRMLKAQILPWDDVDAEEILASLAPKFIIRYESGGKRYIQIVTFEKHQRPHVREVPSEIPGPKGSAKARPRRCSDTAQAMHGMLDKGNGEGEGNGERSPAGFTDFWNVYPKKEAKQDALKAWSKLAVPPELCAVILADVKRKALTEDWRKEGGKFIPYPATYLRGRRFDDQGVVLPKATLAPDMATTAHLAARG